MDSTSLTVVTLGIAAHLALACWLVRILIKHRRNVSHHRFSMGTIGRDPALTEALHALMSQKQPQTDWLNPHVLRGKITAWRNSQPSHGEDHS